MTFPTGLRLAILRTAVLLAACAPAAAWAVDSSAMQDLAHKVGCFSCHGIAHKKVGPAWQAVAARFAGNPNATAILQDAIMNGHQGTWGVIPMPAYAPDGYITNQQAHDLAAWIMTLAPARPGGAKQ